MLFRKKEEVLDGKKIIKLLKNERELKRFLNCYFDLLDEDKSGYLSREELKPAMIRFGVLLGLPPPGTMEETDRLVEKMFQEVMVCVEKGNGEIDRRTFTSLCTNFLKEAGEALNDSPVLVTTCDGLLLEKMLADKQGFAVIIDRLFGEFDKDNSGKLSRQELKPAIHALGLDKDLPTVGARKQLDALIESLLIKYGGADREINKEEFSELLADVIRDMSGHLTAQPLLMEEGRVVLNGSQIRKLLKDEARFAAVANETFDEWDILSSGKLDNHQLGVGFKRLGTLYGLPPVEEDEAEIVFSSLLMAGDEDGNGFIEKEEFGGLLRSIFLSIANQLEKKPVYVSSSSFTDGKVKGVDSVQFYATESASPAPASNSLPERTSSGATPAVSASFTAAATEFFGSFSVPRFTSLPTEPKKPAPRSADAIKAAYGKPQDAASAAQDARDKLVQRGEKLQNMNKQAEDLESDSADFADLAAELAKKMEKRWW